MRIGTTLRNRNRLSILIVLLVLLAFIAGCGGSGGAGGSGLPGDTGGTGSNGGGGNSGGDDDGSTGGGNPGAVLQQLQISPVNPSLAAGTKTQFTVIGLYSDNSTRSLTESVTYTSSDINTASIAEDGNATGKKPGSVTITATEETTKKTVSTQLRVTDAQLTDMQLDSTTLNAPQGVSVQVTAIGTFSDLSTQDLTGQVTWTSSEPEIATVSNADGTHGLVTAHKPGTVTITAQMEGVGVIGSVTLTITQAELVSVQVSPVNPSQPLGTRKQFSATGIYTDNSTLDITSNVTWSSSDSNIVSISNDQDTKGMAVTHAPGAADITAAYAGTTITGTTRITVTDAELISIAIEPVNSSTAKGLSRQFTATGTFTDNSTKDLTGSLTWTSSDITIASISNLQDSRGLATAQGVGQATITAAYPGTDVTASTLLAVTPAELVSLQVTSTASSVAHGLTMQMTATGTYTDKTTQDLTQAVTWTSGDQTVAQVSNNPATAGLVTTFGAGNTSITASYQGLNVSGSNSITVTQAELVSITVAPADQSIPLGLTQQYSAVGAYTDGSTRDITEQVTWLSTEPGTAGISNENGSKGLASTIGSGSASITATFPGTCINGSAQLTVTEATLVSLQISPSDASMPKGLTQQFTATGTYTDGSTRDLTGAVTWESSNPNALAVSNASGSQGLATSMNIGSAVISASYQGTRIDASTKFEVTQAVLVSIQVTPVDSSVVQGSTRQFTAIGTYSDTTTQDITGLVTWSSQNPAAATISNADAGKGLAAGVGEGTTTIAATHPGSGIAGSTGLTVTGKRQLYISNHIANAISVVKTLDWSIAHTINLGNGSIKPQGIAVTPDGRYAYVGASSTSSKKLYVIDIASNTVATTIALAKSPSEVVISPDGQYVYAVTGNVTKIRTSDNSVVTTIPVSDAYDIDISPDGNYLYVSLFNSHSVAVVRTSNDSVTATIPLSTGSKVGPTGIAVSPDGQFVYTANITADTVSVIKTGSNKLQATISLGKHNAPLDITVTPDSRYVYVTNLLSRTVKVLRTADNTIIRTIAAGKDPAVIKASPDGDYVFVANYQSHNISVIRTGDNTVIKTMNAGKFPAGIGIR